MFKPGGLDPAHTDLSIFRLFMTFSYVFSSDFVFFWLCDFPTIPLLIPDELLKLNPAIQGSLCPPLVSMDQTKVF